jgi:hypothetical protein
VFESWVRKQSWGEEKYMTVALHGDATVYESTFQMRESDLSPDMAKDFKMKDPDYFKPHHTSSNEHTLNLRTSESDRVNRAWQYIYSHGCVGKKSPF